MTVGLALAAGDHAMSSGTVAKIDTKWKKITIDHALLETLNMPAMKMVFDEGTPASSTV